MSKKKDKKLKINPNNFCIDDVIAFVKENKGADIKMKEKVSKDKKSDKKKSKASKDDNVIDKLAKKVIATDNHPTVQTDEVVVI